MKTAHSSETVLNIGPQHPSVNGFMKLITKLDGEIIKSVEPVIGYTHRGIEKLAESKTYLQYLPITNMIDYLSGFIYQETYCSAVEKLADINVPERAKYIRVMLSELNRVASHLFWLGTYLANLGGKAQFYYTFREREMILNIFRNICGQRIMCNFHTFGGVKHDLKNDILNQIGDFISIFPQRVKEYQDLITNNPIFRARTSNLGIITKNKAVSYALTGANLRSTGINSDVRKINPYLLYNELEFQVPTDNTGDCHSRCLLRIREMIESLKIIRQCNRFLIKSQGEYKNFDVNPLQIKPTSNLVISQAESPRGTIVCTIISDGSDKPARVKWRTPSLYAIQILPELLKNRNYSDMTAILGSLDIIVSEADR